MWCGDAVQIQNTDFLIPLCFLIRFGHLLAASRENSPAAQTVRLVAAVSPNLINGILQQVSVQFCGSDLASCLQPKCCKLPLVLLYVTLAVAGMGKGIPVYKNII